MLCIADDKLIVFVQKAKNLVAQTLPRYEHNKLMYIIIPDGDVERKKIFFCTYRKKSAPEGYKRVHKQMKQITYGI